MQQLKEAWESGMALGESGVLYQLQGLRLLQAERLGSTLTVDLPPALASLADVVEAATAEVPSGKQAQQQAIPSIPLAQTLTSLLLSEGGRMRRWVAMELQRSCHGVQAAEKEPSFEELRPFLVPFRTEVARREAFLRFLDVLGAPTLARHPPRSRYRMAFSEVLGPMWTPFSNKGGGGSSSSTAPPPQGRLPIPGCRESLLTRSVLQGLVVWPKDALLLESLLEAMWELCELNLEGVNDKLPRRVLKCSEDPRLYFVYARGLWARKDLNAARAALLRLAAAPAADSPNSADVRIAVAWWHMEFRKAREEEPLLEGQPPRAFRILRAMALGGFSDEKAVLDGGPVGAEGRLQTLQIIARLQKNLPSQSRGDASGCRLLLSSYHSTLVALCAMVPAHRALEILKTEIPGLSSAQGHSAKENAEEERCWCLVSSIIVELIAASKQTTPGLLLEAVRLALKLNPFDPWLLRRLAAVHVQRGSIAALRRELDALFSFHRPPSLSGAIPGPAALQVVLESELCAGAAYCPERLLRICEMALSGALGTAPFACGAVWSLYHLAILLAMQGPAKSQGLTEGQLANLRETRWRVAVRSVRGGPLFKTLWLLQLAAWEARADGTGAPPDEDEVVDLVESIEAKHILLLGDPLEAVA